MDTSSINVGSLKAAVKNLGYDFFENGDYNLNIIGIRANPGTPNKFDDVGNLRNIFVLQILVCTI